MRITFVYGAYPPIPDGGAGFLDNLTRALSRRGHDVSVITTNQVAASYTNVPQSHNVNVLPIIEDWRISKSSYQELRNALRQTNPEIIHAIYPSATFGRTYQLPMLLKFAHRASLVTTLYGFGVKQGLVNQAVIFTLLHMSNLLLSDNDHVITLIRKYLPHISYRLRYLPSGSNIVRYTPISYPRPELRRQLGLHEDRFYICYFGYLGKYRGVDTLFEALKVCLDKDLDVGLIMIGTGPKTCPERGDAEYFHYLTDLADKLGISQDIIWTEFGTEDQVARYFQASNICTLPYRQNTLGHSSLPAALSFGLPVITTAPSHKKTLPPLVDHHNAVLISPGDFIGLAKAITELLEDPQLLEGLGKEAYKLWERVFSWDAICDRALQIYQEVI